MPITQNKQQRKAITHGRHPLMVVAGPGSGKTFVITERICYILDELGADPSSVLVVTFSRAAAAQMRDRFVAKYTARHTSHERSVHPASPEQGRLSQGQYTYNMRSDRGRDSSRHSDITDYTKVTFATFHSFFYHILLTAYGKHAERYIFPQGNVSPADSKNTKRGGYTVESALRPEYGSVSFQDTGYVNPAHDIYGYALPAASAASAASAGTSGVALPSVSTDPTPDSEDGIRFDEMIALTEELLTRRDDIRQAIKARYQWILIDEFQDIDPAQYRIIRLITDSRSNLTIVGDDDQSIYAFRGSDPSIMLNFRRDYPGARKVVLNINYRSTAEIVAYSQRVIRHNEKRISKHLRSASGRGGMVSIIPCLNITDEIEKLYMAIEICLHRGIPMSDMAVLYRTNFQPRPLLLLFKEHCVDISGLHMMTFHTSKGLEWPVVFIIDVNDGITPHRKSKSSDELEEERRAFYVAMTRAKKELHLFYCLRRYEKKSAPSPYLTEMKSLPQRALERLALNCHSQDVAF